MTWVLIIAVAWLAVSVIAALLISGMIRLADGRRTRSTAPDQGNFAVDLSFESVPSSRRAPRSARRPVLRHGTQPVQHPSEPRQTGTR